MQTKFLRREYWLPLLAAGIFLAGGSLAFAQEGPKVETCSSDICYIKVTHGGFLPERLVVRDGSTVIWKNVDEGGAHMIAGGNTKNPTLFNSSLLSSGRDYAFVFNGGLTGKFTYIDQGVNNVAGEIAVVPRIPENTLKQLGVDLADPGSGLKVAMERGNVTAATATPKLHRVTLWVDAPAQGMLKVVVDRRLLDSQIVAGRDVPFTVLADGKPAVYKEMFATSAQRTLVMPVAGDTKNVTIVGRQMSVDMLGYGEAQAALGRAEKAIAEFRAKGVVVADAEGVFLNAQDAFVAGKYHFAASLANRAADLASSAGRTAQAAAQAMNVAGSSINATKTLGISVPEAEEMLKRTKEMYVYGGYDDALSMAVQAKIAATDSANQLYMVAGIASVSAGWVAVYLRLGRKGGIIMTRRNNNPARDGQVLAAPAAATTTTAEVQQSSGCLLPVKMENPASLDLDAVFAAKPHIRRGDRDVLQYIVGQQNGEALLADIRNRFLLPKSSAWRLVKRLEREELVEIVKFGNQNLIRCRLQDSDNYNGI